MTKDEMIAFLNSFPVTGTLSYSEPLHVRLTRLYDPEPVVVYNGMDSLVIYHNKRMALLWMKITN